MPNEWQQASNYPLLAPDVPAGTGDGAAPPVQLPEPVVTANAEPVVAPVVEPPIETANLAELTQQMLMQQQQQARVLADLQERLEASQRPRPEDDLRSDEQKRLDEMYLRVNQLHEHAERQDNQRYVQAAVSDATALLDRLVGSDPLTKSNPALARAVKAEIMAIVQPIVAANPRQHGLSTRDVHKWFNDKLSVYKAVHESWPGQAAQAAQQQASINSRAVDVGTGSSPSPTDAKPGPEAGSDEWWDQKRTKLRAAAEKYAPHQ